MTSLKSKHNNSRKILIKINQFIIHDHQIRQKIKFQYDKNKKKLNTKRI